MDYCNEYPELAKYLNICDYSILDLSLIFLGTFFWMIAYFIIIRNAFNNKFIEMPVVAGAANIAWEFSWGFLFKTDIGLVFVWGLRIWFLMDILILYGLLKWGYKQSKNKLFIKNFKLITLLQVLVWIPIYIFFLNEGYDTSMGATSAYLICVLMAVLYVTTYVNSNHKDKYSIWVAWLKGIANTLMTIFIFIHYKEMHFLQSMAVIVFIFNIWYIFLRHKMDIKSAEI